MSEEEMLTYRIRNLSRRRFLAGLAGAGAACSLGGPLIAAAAAGATRPGDGEQLYDVVRRYAQWPHHRTATGFGRATVAFFEQELRARGATTARWPYPVDLFSWSAQVTAGDADIEALPVYFEATGTARTDSPFVQGVTLPNASSLAPLTNAITAAAASGASIAVIPTSGSFPAVPGVANLPYGPYDALIAANVQPHGPRSGVHTLLVSGEHADAIAAGPTTASVRASITSASAEHVTAWFHRPVPDPVLITTPLTGWFDCAGERGTGIAIALDLAAELAREGEPVFVLGTTSHEFENHGAAQYLLAHQLTPRAVFHVGASAAAGVRDELTGRLTLAPLRLWNTTTPSPDLSNAMTLGRFLFHPQFLVEGQLWSAALPAGTPLLSLAGSFPLFHTPGDEPAVATSPELLGTVYRSLRAAVEVIV